MRKPELFHKLLNFLFWFYHNMIKVLCYFFTSSVTSAGKKEAKIKAAKMSKLGDMFRVPALTFSLSTKQQHVVPLVLNMIHPQKLCETSVVRGNTFIHLQRRKPRNIFLVESDRSGPRKNPDRCNPIALSCYDVVKFPQSGWREGFFNVLTLSFSLPIRCLGVSSLFSIKTTGFPETPAAVSRVTLCWGPSTAAARKLLEGASRTFRPRRFEARPGSDANLALYCWLISLADDEDHWSY